MAQVERQQAVLEILQGLRDLGGLRRLFAELNYDYPRFRQWGAPQGRNRTAQGVSPGNNGAVSASPERAAPHLDRSLSGAACA